jgi:hypothetical protein
VLIIERATEGVIQEFKIPKVVLLAMLLDKCPQIPLKPFVELSVVSLYYENGEHVNNFLHYIIVSENSSKRFGELNASP